MRRWYIWALVASLGLNLAFAGLIAGVWFKGPPPLPPMAGFWHYARALPEPYARALGRAFREDGGGPHGPREQAHADRDALAAALTAAPYDPAAVRALLLTQAARVNDVVTRGETLLLEQIDRMSAEDRAAYAKALRNPPPKPDGPPRR